jgi:hypothetical protein
LRVDVRARERGRVVRRIGGDRHGGAMGACGRRAVGRARAFERLDARDDDRPESPPEILGPAVTS